MTTPVESDDLSLKQVRAALLELNPDRVKRESGRTTHGFYLKGETAVDKHRRYKKIYLQKLSEYLTHLEIVYTTLHKSDTSSLFSGIKDPELNVSRERRKKRRPKANSEEQRLERRRETNRVSNLRSYYNVKLRNKNLFTKVEILERELGIYDEDSTLTFLI